MSAKLVVEEIPASATKDEIHEFFSAMGSVITIAEAQDELQRHAWIIEMSSFEDAHNVIAQLDDVINIRLVA